MKPYIKNVRINRILLGFFFMICTITVSFNMYAATLSFNSLFPTTWYEKGMNATVSVWHKVCSVIDEKTESHDIEVFDVILGRFAFAHFCLEKMYQNKQYVIDEDIMYLATLLHRLENQLIAHAASVSDQERIMCLVRMVERMKQSLQVPSNI